MGKLNGNGSGDDFGDEETPVADEPLSFCATALPGAGLVIIESYKGGVVELHGPKQVCALIEQLARALPFMRGWKKGE
jgi:hypothetical protein